MLVVQHWKRLTPTKIPETQNYSYKQPDKTLAAEPTAPITVGEASESQHACQQSVTGQQGESKCTSLLPSYLFCHERN